VTLYIPPIDGAPRVSQNYGDNPGGANPPGGHNGRDYAVPVGTPVRAVADGVILFEGFTAGDYSQNPWWFLPDDLVIVLHASDSGVQFVYGHLNDSVVDGGQVVKQGDIIGYTGNTGKSTGPHLHFEALAPGYDLNDGMYGRTDPGQYIDVINTHNTEQETDMPLTPEDVNAVVHGILDFQVQQAGEGMTGTMNLGQLIAEYRSNNNHIVQNTANAINTNPTVLAQQIVAAGMAKDIYTELGKLFQNASN